MTVLRLILVNALIRVAAAASGQLFAFLLAERVGGPSGLGSAFVGALGGSFFVAELFGAPVAGRIADARGHRRVLKIGPVLGVLSASVAAAAFRIPHLGVLLAVLIVARTSEGLSAACAVPTTLTLLSRATEGDPVRRTRVMGLFEITSLIGMIVGYAVAGVGWDAVGARAFLLLPPLYGLAFALVGAPEREPPQDAAPRPPVLRTMRRLAAERGSLAFGVAWLAVNAVVGVWLQQAPYLLKLPERSPTQSLVGGYSGTTIGIVFSVWGITFLIGLGLWSALGAAWPRRRTLAASLVAMMGVAATLALVNHGAPRGALALVVACILVESGFTPAALAHLADITRRHDESRGAALGLYSLLLGGGQLVGNAAGAPFAARWQMDGVLLVTAILALVALAGVARMGGPPGHAGA